MKNEQAWSVGTHQMAPTGGDQSLPTASTQQFRDKKNTLPSLGPFSPLSNREKQPAPA